MPAEHLKIQMSKVSNDELRQKLLEYMAAAPDDGFKKIWPKLQNDPSLKGRVAMGSGLSEFLALTQQAQESGTTFAAMLDKANGHDRAADSASDPDKMRQVLLERLVASPDAEFKALWPLIEKDERIGKQSMSVGLETFLAISQESRESGMTFADMLDGRTNAGDTENSVDCPPPPPEAMKMEVVIDPKNFVGCNIPGCDDEDCGQTDAVPGGGETYFDVRVEKYLQVSTEELPKMIVSDAKKTVRSLVDEDHSGYVALRDRVGTSTRTTLGFKAYFKARLGDDGMVYINISRTCKGSF